MLLPDRSSIDIGSSGPLVDRQGEAMNNRENLERRLDALHSLYPPDSLMPLDEYELECRLNRRLGRMLPDPERVIGATPRDWMRFCERMDRWEKSENLPPVPLGREPSEAA